MNLILLSHDDTAALLAAVADVEAVCEGNSVEDVSLDKAVSELSRIASIIGGQVEAQ